MLWKVDLPRKQSKLAPVVTTISREVVAADMAEAAAMVDMVETMVEKETSSHGNEDPPVAQLLGNKVETAEGMIDLITITTTAMLRETLQLVLLVVMRHGNNLKERLEAMLHHGHNLSTTKATTEVPLQIHGVQLLIKSQWFNLP